MSETAALAQAPREVCATLAVDPRSGLSTAEVLARREQHGTNALPEEPPTPKIVVFLEQFKNRLIAILIVAAVVAFFVSGEIKDPIIIGAVVLFNAVLGYLQEQRAEASLAALKKMLVATARVRRDRTLVEIPSTEIVPGDIVQLLPGDRVPADGRWIEARDLEVDEAAFTGESAPVVKTESPVAADAPLAEQRSMGFMNTTVTRGRGELVVTATGAQTEIGRLAGMLQEADPGKTPLQKQIDDLANRLTIIAGVAVVAIGALNLIQGLPFDDTLLNAVALAVAAIPEGLPAVLTVTLAIGTHQLAKRHAIVKRLSSVETLGSTTVICTDKTGTLTLNQMTAVRAWMPEVGEENLEAGSTPDSRLGELFEPAALCNDAHVVDGTLIGDPTEGALVSGAERVGLDPTTMRATRPRVAEIPFDSATKFMATFHQQPGTDQLLVCVKGAPDIVLAHVAERSLTSDAHRANDALASEGLRVIAVATAQIEPSAISAGVSVDMLEELHFVGLIGIMDPPRPEARDAIAICRRAGIAVKMITGDHAITAGAIAERLGLEGDVVSGRELDDMSDEELTMRVDHISVFARVAPEHKVRLVKVLKSRGDVVAMTGDGVNDAPALKNADIGVAMGITGTEVTKEAATMVLADDNFATIVEAVRGGRTIYDNILKFVRFQLATNMGAILTILTATVLALPAGGGVFFTPIALLWVNIIMDGPPALALGVDPPDPDAMRRPPRAPSERILDGGRIVRLLIAAVVMAVGTIGIYVYAAGGFEVIDEPAHARASLMAFTVFVLFQIFNLFNARFEKLTVFGSHTIRNGKLWLALAVVLALQLLAVFWGPLQRLITGDEVTATLSPTDWVVMVAVAASIVVVSEIVKLVLRRAEPASELVTTTSGQ